MIHLIFYNLDPQDLQNRRKDQKRYLGRPKKVTGRFFPDLFTGFFQLLLLGLDLIKGLGFQQRQSQPGCEKNGASRGVPCILWLNESCVNRFDQIRGPMRPTHHPPKITGKKRCHPKKIPCLDIVCKRCQSGGTNIQGLQSRQPKQPPFGWS